MDVKSSKMDVCFSYSIGGKHVKVEQDRDLDVYFLCAGIHQ